MSAPKIVPPRVTSTKPKPKPKPATTPPASAGQGFQYYPPGDPFLAGTPFATTGAYVPAFSGQKPVTGNQPGAGRPVPEPPGYGQVGMGPTPPPGQVYGGAVVGAEVKPPKGEMVWQYDPATGYSLEPAKPFTPTPQGQGPNEYAAMSDAVVPEPPSWSQWTPANPNQWPLDEHGVPYDPNRPRPGSVWQQPALPNVDAEMGAALRAWLAAHPQVAARVGNFGELISAITHTQTSVHAAGASAAPMSTGFVWNGSAWVPTAPALTAAPPAAAHTPPKLEGPTGPPAREGDGRMYHTESAQSPVPSTSPIPAPPTPAPANFNPQSGTLAGPQTTPSASARGHATWTEEPTNPLYPRGGPWTRGA